VLTPLASRMERLSLYPLVPTHLISPLTVVLRSATSHGSIIRAVSRSVLAGEANLKGKKERIAKKRDGKSIVRPIA
jgi:hypothetical protein